MGKIAKGNSSQVGVMLPVEIFKRGERKKVAQAGLLYTENKIKDYEFKLKLRIRTSYFNLLLAKSQLQIMEERKELLEDLYERVSDKLSKSEFDALLKEEMATIYSFEEFEYGCEEMPAMSSPLSYVNQLLYNSGGESLELTDAQVSNCVDLRVYKEGSAYPSDHMMACIEGYWYFIV